MNDIGFSSPVVTLTNSEARWADAQAQSRVVEPITSLENLRLHLQWAIEMEHSTIPPYLCALYSIQPGHNREAVEVISSILVEEMLHLTLAANLLNAIGGTPKLDVPEMLPRYPHPLPHSNRAFEISLLPFGRSAIDTFLKIEMPSAPSGPPEGDAYETIGQFYQAIEQGFRHLSVILGESNLFCGDPARQVNDQHSYSGGGQIIDVHNLQTALSALNETVEQGEGTQHAQVWDGDSDVFHPGNDQVAHYFLFEELISSRRYRRGDSPRSGPSGDSVLIDWGAVWPMRPNPRIADHAPGSSIRVAQEEFNRLYCELLQLLEQAFNGKPRILGTAIGTMYSLRKQAQALMQMQNEDGLTTAGPTFEYIASQRRAAR